MTPEGTEQFPTRTRGAGPHAEQSIAVSGPPPERANLVLVLLHGRGGSADDMIGLGQHLALPDVAVVAPEAAGRSWWPQSFLAPLAENEPRLSSGLSVVEALLNDLEALGFGADRVVLGGFSQGACLALEAAARLAQPFRAVIGMSGGLVGTADEAGPARDDLYGRADKSFDYSGSLAAGDGQGGVPVLLGCHERDPHIPLARVERSAAVLTAMGALVERITMPGAGHGVVEEEIAWLRGQLNG